MLAEQERCSSEFGWTREPRRLVERLWVMVGPGYEDCQRLALGQRRGGTMLQIDCERQTTKLVYSPVVLRSTPRLNTLNLQDAGL